ncbi:MAG: diguanylate cyclase [Mariprofundaceae bacterium]|nr:diguanylate cyclase [Mariprofundaceae bacterium]
MKVLIVDDSRMYLSMLDAYIQDMGHQTILANSGKEAIALYQSDEPDLILLDVTMPDMDGYEVAQHIRDCPRRVWVPIIFLSALVEDKDILRGIEAGGDDYITKPASQVMIQAKVQAMQRIAKMSQKLIKTSAKLQKANQKLQSLSLLDGLTQIANRRCFDTTLHQEWSRAVRNQTSLSLMLIDIDHFKLYNDCYGHQQGDACLIEVAQTLKKHRKRPSDLVARYGGEEFVVIFPDCKAEALQGIAQQLCNTIQDLNIPHADSPTHACISISIGVSNQTPQRGSNQEQLIKAADLALYKAKREGRNRVCYNDENIENVTPS